MRPMYLKNGKTKSTCCNLNSCMQFSSHGASLLRGMLPSDSLFHEMGYIWFRSQFLFPPFLILSRFCSCYVVQFELQHCHLDICNWKKLLVLKVLPTFKHILTHSLVTVLETVQCFAFRGANVELYIFIR